MKSSIFRQDLSKFAEWTIDKRSYRKASLQGSVLTFCRMVRDNSISTSLTHRLPVYSQHTIRSAQDFKRFLLILDIQFEINLLLKRKASHHLKIIRPQRSKWDKVRNPQLLIIFKFCPLFDTIILIKLAPPFEVHVLWFQIQNRLYINK